MRALAYFTHFTDIEFNPKKSINTQARSVALIRQLLADYGELRNLFAITRRTEKSGGFAKIRVGFLFHHRRLNGRRVVPIPKFGGYLQGAFYVVGAGGGANLGLAQLVVV